MRRLTDDWLSSVATATVTGALEKAGYRALFVGGCVRNALLGAPVSDIDIATDALPQDVITISEAAELQAVPTGIEHGTVTIVSDGIPHEVTTFRRDIETDGRRAVVAFSPNVDDDARRRDFTMNALYAASDGVVLDPLGEGLADLDARRVRFIEDPVARIREDYLRSLRFFRFYAWYGDPYEGPDQAALDAIAGNLDGLEQLSAERVGAEMLKLLAAPDPAPALAGMSSTGVLARLLPGSDARFVAPLVHLEQGIGEAPAALRRLAALGGADSGDRLRLSRKEARNLGLLRDLMGGTVKPAELGYRHGQQAAIDTELLRAATMGVPLEPAMRAEATRGAGAVFPVTARDLDPTLEGAAIGDALRELEAEWIASDFTATRATLLAAHRGE